MSIQMSIGVPGAAMAMPAAPRSASEPLTKLQLNFSCKGLTNKDSLSKSDPALYVYMLNGTHETLLGVTETVANDLSPQWAYSLVVDYFFERQQMLRFYVVDVDGASKDRSAHDQLGTCDVPLAQIVSGKNGRLTMPLKGKGAGKGTLTVTSEELSGANELLTFSVLAKNIDKKDFLGKSDGFLVFKRAAEGGAWIAVHKTEVVKNSLNPVWKPITISLTQLANGDWDRPLRIELYDWDANSDADFIGQFDTSANALRAAAGGAGIPLINAELAKKKGKKYDNSGVFHVTAFKAEKQHSFVDYLRSGTRINCIVSIDFTASNGDPKFAQSLHHQNPYEPNPYQKAINSVGTVLIDYDSDKQFVAYGFGARVPPNNKTSHCFPLTYNLMQPEVPGIPGLLAAYANVLMTSELYGPTNFAPTIHQTISISKARPGEYLVLLILTDGTISDQQDTIDAIVAAAEHPISIIIVGVGSADFDQMNVLDGDGGRLRDSRGKFASHDIVQFVPFRQFERQPLPALAAEVLREVPDQFLHFMKANGIVPVPGV
jgi:hypothetical protein